MKLISPEARQVVEMADITDILDMLIERTEQVKVAWQPTSAERVFTAVFGSYSVLIEIDSGHDTVLRVLNKEGNEIERLDSGTTKGRGWVSRLTGLHDHARRTALRVDSQLDELLSELEIDPEPS